MSRTQINYTESERIAALKSYQILDTVEEKKYDDLTQLVARICETPTCLITLIDECRQWFKSHHGLDLKETPKEISICNHVVIDRKKIVIEDISQDPRFKDNTAIIASNIKFYAGVPLTDKDGFVLGSFCVADFKPHTLSEFQLFTLETVASQIVESFSLQRELNKSKEKDFFLQQFTQQVP